MVAFSQDVFDAFVADDDDAPVVMLNLIRFAPDGRQRYYEYLEMARPILDRFGARIRMGGNGLPVLTTGDSSGWDAVLLVEYPSHAAFARMVADSDYQAAFKVGASAIDSITLQPLKPDARMA